MAIAVWARMNRIDQFIKGLAPEEEVMGAEVHDDNWVRFHVVWHHEGADGTTPTIGGLSDTKLMMAALARLMHEAGLAYEEPIYDELMRRLPAVREGVRQWTR
jgi:hypothetical protein